MKTSYKFSQADWKLTAFSTFFLVVFFYVLKSYFSIGMAMLISIGVGIPIGLLLRKYFISVVEFNDTYLQLKEGLKNKKVKVYYSDISKIVFFYNRFMILQIVTLGNKVKLPPPSKLDKVEELFQWLAIKNPAIEMEIKEK